MNLIRSFAILFASGVATSQAQVRRRADDKTRATKAICDDIENGQAKGLCIAYCEAKDSVTEAEDHPSCATFKADLEEVLAEVRVLTEVSSQAEVSLSSLTTPMPSPAPTTSPATCDCACNCDFTNKQPFASFCTWGNEGDYCPDDTPGWNYAICLQTGGDIDVEKTRGTITLFPPASSCANVQQEIVCVIDEFRSFTFPGDVFFTAAGKASYDDATHPCFVKFGYLGGNNFIKFVLLNDVADPDNGWDGSPLGGTVYRQAFSDDGPTQGAGFTDNMLDDFTFCGILPE